MRAVVTLAAIAMLLAGCTHDSDSDLDGRPETPLPTYDGSQAWKGADSPVLGWDQAQREAFLAEYSDATSQALRADGLATEPGTDANATDTMRRAQTVGPLLPRPARELALLAVAQNRAGESSTAAREAAILDAAWLACLELQDGSTYEDLVYQAGAAYGTRNSAENARATLVGALYAPVVCYEFADDAVAAIAGTSGLEVPD